MTPREYTASIFLERLQRLIDLLRIHRQDMSPDGELLIERAAGATYGDCCEYGVGAEADAIVRASRGVQR